MATDPVGDNLAIEDGQHEEDRERDAHDPRARLRVTGHEADEETAQGCIEHIFQQHASVSRGGIVRLAVARVEVGDQRLPVRTLARHARPGAFALWPRLIAVLLTDPAVNAETAGWDSSR
jgi:hypothetical protein